MNKNRLIGIEQWKGLFDSSTRFEQHGALIANTDIQTKIIVGLEIIYNLTCKVVHIYHNALITRVFKFLDYMPNERLPPYPHQRLWHGVG